MTEKKLFGDQEVVSFLSKINSSSDLIELLESYLPVVDLNNKTIYCKMPPYYDKYIKELVEWDRFRIEVETLLTQGFKSFYTTGKGLRLDWNERGLDFYLTYTNGVWMIVDSFGKYSTHNVDSSNDLFIFSHALNIYLGILYRYLSVYVGGNIQRQPVTSIDKIGDGITINLTNIAGCKFDSFCANKDPFNCLECVRNFTSVMSSKSPEKLIDNFEKK